MAGSSWSRCCWISASIASIRGVFGATRAAWQSLTAADFTVPPRLAPKPGGATSYPSSHATEGAVDACVLGLIFPDRAAQLTGYGRYVGDLRVISGVHHPSDVAAGPELAAAICGRLVQESDFNAEVAKLRSAVSP